MSETKHAWTPGEWKIQRYPENGMLYIGTPGTTVAAINVAWAGAEETEANAALLNAAPRLVATLDALLSDVFFAGAEDQFCEVCQRGVPVDEDGRSIGRVEHAADCAYHRARSALSAARGEEGQS